MAGTKLARRGLATGRCPRVRSGGRGACGEPLPANTLCRERETFWRPDRWLDRWLDRAAAPVDFAALVDPMALQTLRRWCFWWCLHSGGLVVQVGARGGELKLAADHLREEVGLVRWTGGSLRDVEAGCW
ncbi:hypothetical protein NDU88_003197 [Pleurodeles waltl]|uniref:Uncharacterized protein n=1 Tax=Pleurodeles waltl TaxID=8319 RepID=A0AAV7M3V1_PLEWA|nr:hypothetical protein NDU88_003197 [Pleurodeles waltl]